MAQGDVGSSNTAGQDAACPDAEALPELGSAFPMPQGPELPKSAAGASPNLLEVSTDFTPICEHGSTRSLLSVFLPP